MGKITSQFVVTGSDKPRKVKKLQPGDREWIILVQAVSATGKCILPFITFAGKVLISAGLSWVYHVTGLSKSVQMAGRATL
jgi:hypothetical protein